MTREVTVSSEVLDALEWLLPNDQQKDKHPHIYAYAFEPHPQGGVLAMVTDSEVMLIVHDPSGYAAGKAHCPVTDDLLAAVRACGGNPTPVMFMDDLTLIGADMIPLPPEKEFVDWRKLLAPEPPSAGVTWLSQGKLIAGLNEAFTSLCATHDLHYAIVNYGTYAPTLVYADPLKYPAVGLIMPCVPEETNKPTILDVRSL